MHPNDLADSIKQMLYTKSVEKIDGVRPYLGAQMFDPTEQETEEENEQNFIGWNWIRSCT